MNRKKIISIIAIIMAILMAFSLVASVLPTAFAITQDDIDELQRKSHQNCHDNGNDGNNLLSVHGSDLQIIADGIYASERTDQDADPEICEEQRKHHPVERNKRQKAPGQRIHQAAVEQRIDPPLRQEA